MFGILDQTNSKENVCVVRLTTSYWSDKRGVYSKKHIRIIRTKCTGSNILDEHISNIGAEGTVIDIINLDECMDGLYEVVTCNETHDFESGYIDGYNLKLIKHISI